MAQFAPIFCLAQQALLGGGSKWLEPQHPDCKAWSAQGMHSLRKNFWLFSRKNFFDGPISAQVFRPVCCVTLAVSKKGVLILLLPRTERFQYNPYSFALHLDGLSANAVFRVRICAQIACNRILRCKFSELKPMFFAH